jgi:cysteine-rich repeat protein
VRADAAPGDITECGDGVRTDPETCDDGNSDAADGCDSSCQIEAGYVCPTDDAMCVKQCGNHEVDDGEACDDGNDITEPCAYGETDCSVCGPGCQMHAGVIARCGDGTVDEGHEDCDDGNATTESCEYTESSCTVCDATCHNSAGLVPACGDGHTDAPSETCDDGNHVTEACSYGQATCQVCNETCQTAASTGSRCGDGAIDSANGEQCDDSNTTAADGCDGSCHTEYVASCGNSVRDAGETCDDGNTTNLDGCSAACIAETGWTCPNTGACSETCGDTKVVGAEVCDDGNQVDTDYCKNNCRTKGRCGDSLVQAGATETCDDGNTMTETCSYGQQSCTVCNASCKSVAGAATWCGDGFVQGAKGEQCDSSTDIRCGSDCKWKCDTIYISYDLTSSFQITHTTMNLGNGTFPQTGGKLIVALTAGASGPVDGPAGTTYLYSPVHTMQTINYIGSATITSNVVGSAGSVSNKCRLGESTLSGTQMTHAACPYLGSHGTAEWSPSQQQVTKPNGPACLEYSSVGAVTCSGSLCGAAGLPPSGTTQINDQWDQPGATLVFMNSFSKVQARALGTPTPNSGSPTDKTEIPNTVGGRTWINFDGVETSRVCAMKPTNCPSPGAQ